MKVPNLIKNACFFILAFVWVLKLNAQKVGLVLSGGGAGGLSHIGVIKALEENNIPIDYITGTSIGSLIGGLYASGYTPAEIEAIFTSEQFLRMTRGQMETRYAYSFKKRDDDASWTSFKFSFDSALVTNLPTNLISSVPIDFALLEMFAKPMAASNKNFDSLMIPFRCIASDVEDKKSVVFKDGDLATAVRASMTYPFYLKPINVDGRLLFDGGLYNNFPSNIMYNDFYPDFIIGSTVTSNAPHANEDNLYLQLRNMLMSKTDFQPACENGILIKPWSDVGIFDFASAKRLIDSGYAATIRNIESIKNNTFRKESPEQLKAKRELFKAKFREVLFDEIEIEGLNRRQKRYVIRLLERKKKTVSLEKIKSRYFRLAEDDKIKSIFPTAQYNSTTGNYKLNLRIKKEKDLIIFLGGNFSNRPISEGYVGLQYNYLGKIAITVNGNGYFGRLHTSAQGKIRFDFPSSIPIYVEPGVTYSRWDYYRSSTLFYDLEKPPYLTQRDKYGHLDFGFALGNKGQFKLGGGIAELTNLYYQTSNFTSLDTTDRTDFDFATGHLEYVRNSLNRKLYASDGNFIQLRAKYISGIEILYPGTTSTDSVIVRQPHDWVFFKAKIDHYIKPANFFSFGILLEGVFSTQTFFQNYTSSILSSPAFMPTPESQTLFLEKFRAHQYAAGGIKLIFHPIRNFDIRLESYLFQPIKSIEKNKFNQAQYSQDFLYRYFNGMAALVYHTPIGPISLSGNYYHGEKEPFTFLFHFGYTIFNKRSID